MVAETKLYDALGIKPTANQQEIKKAYRYVHYSTPSLISDVHRSYSLIPTTNLNI